MCVGDQAGPLGSASYFACELGNGHESEETSDFLGTPHPFPEIKKRSVTDGSRTQSLTPEKR